MRDSTARELMEKVKQDYAVIASDFDRTRRGGWKDFEVFDGYFEKGQKVLDIGCGNGRLKEYLPEGVEYFGTDNNKEFIKIAKERGDHYKVGDFLDLPYSDYKFDLVLSVAAFHHLPSRKYQLKALDEVDRVMKPGSRGVFLVWNLWQKKYRSLFLKTILRLFATFGKYGLHDFFVPWEKKANRYYYAFTQKELKKVFKGFEIEKISLTPSGKNFYIVFKKK